MSDIIKSQDLTAYNVDGLELFFTTDRKVRASQNAIARMCGVSQGAINYFVTKMAEKGDCKMDVVSVQLRAGTRLQGHLLYGSKVIVACLLKYNPERLEQFMEFGVDEGLAQMAGVPVAAVTQVPEGYMIPKTSELLTIAAQLAKEDENRQQFLSDKPGLKGLDDLAKTDKHTALPAGKFIFQELAAEYGLELSRQQCAGLSSMMSMAVWSQNLSKPSKRKVTGNDKTKQGYAVNEYSYDTKDTAVNCLRLKGYIS